MTEGDIHNKGLLPSTWKIKVVPVLLTLVACIYGSWMLIAKAALTNAHAIPLVLASYRALAGAIVMLFTHCVFFTVPNAIGVKERSYSGTLRAAPRFMLLGVFLACSIGGNILALGSLPALTVSVCQPLIPIFVGIVTSLLGIEEIALHKMIGIVFAVSGAIAVVVYDARAESSSSVVTTGNYFRGISFLILNLVGATMYAVFQKGVVQKYPPVLTAGLSFLVASLVLFIATLFTSGVNANVWRLNGGTRLALCYSVFLVTAFNYSVLAWVNKETAPTTVTSFIPLEPMAAALISWQVLGVQITGAQTFGGIAIILGLISFNRKTDAETQPLLSEQTHFP